MIRRSLLAAATIVGLCSAPTYAEEILNPYTSTSPNTYTSTSTSSSPQLEALRVQIDLCNHLIDLAKKASDTQEADMNDQSLYSNMPYREMLLKEDKEHAEYWGEKMESCTRDLTQLQIEYNTSH